MYVIYVSKSRSNRSLIIPSSRNMYPSSSRSRSDLVEEVTGFLSRLIRPRRPLEVGTLPIRTYGTDRPNRAGRFLCPRNLTDRIPPLAKLLCLEGKPPLAKLPLTIFAGKPPLAGKPRWRLGCPNPAWIREKRAVNWPVGGCIAAGPVGVLGYCMLYFRESEWENGREGRWG